MIFQESNIYNVNSSCCDIWHARKAERKGCIDPLHYLQEWLSNTSLSNVTKLFKAGKCTSQRSQQLVKTSTGDFPSPIIQCDFKYCVYTENFPIQFSGGQSHTETFCVRQCMGIQYLLKREKAIYRLGLFMSTFLGLEQVSVRSSRRDPEAQTAYVPSHHIF